MGNIEKPIRNSSKSKDGISKWYIIFAVFLAVNFCFLSYAYYAKFYKNRNTANNSKETDSTLLANTIIFPADTVYVDKDEVDSSDNDEATESVKVQDAEVVYNGKKESSLAQNPSSNNSQKAVVSKITSSANPLAGENNKPAATIANPVTNKGIGKTEEEGHTFLVSLGMFKSKVNALNLMTTLNQQGVEAEIIESDHFTKMPPGYILVIAGKELSSATAYQIGVDMKKKGLDNFVKDAGKFSWR